jgi:hypothetical protein
MYVRYSGDVSYSVSTSPPINETVAAAAGATFSPPLKFATGNGPGAIVVCDLNSDGISDLAVVNNVDGTVTALMGQGNSAFLASGTYAAGSRPVFGASGDFDGDGNADLAIASTDGRVSVLLGKGNGTFQAPVSYLAGVQSSALAVADFNQDGLADLAVTDSANGSISVLLGNADGTFREARRYPAGIDPRGLAIGDINGDGIADLAVASGSTGNVSVLFGSGDGGFQPAYSLSTGGSRAEAVVIADLNNDGKPDLAVATPLGVIILSGNGDGTFGAPAIYDAGVNPQSMTVADLNGDGFRDLLIVTADGSVNYLTGNGEGGFRPRQILNTGSDAGPLAVVDFNGDGTADLAIGNHNGASVNILSGRPVVPTGGDEHGRAAIVPDSKSSGNTTPAGATLPKTQNSVTVTLSLSSSFSTYGQPVTLTGTVSPPSSTGKVTFYDGVNVLGSSNLISGTATLKTSLLPAGIRSIQARYGGFNGYIPGPASLECFGPHGRGQWQRWFQPACALPGCQPTLSGGGRRFQ